MRLILLFIIVATCTAIQAATIVVGPNRTFLHTNLDSALASIPIDLSSLGISPGQTIRLQQTGAYLNGSGGSDILTDMIGLFSSSNVINASSALNRVPGAIFSTLPAYVTSNTYNGNQPTDIPQDFFIDDVFVTVPSGAGYLFVSPADVYFTDNSDPNNDYAVRITAVPEPTVTTLMLFGLALFSGRRTRRPHERNG